MTDTNIDIIQDTKEKIIKLLTPSGWANKLSLFLKSSDMDTLLEKLLTESQEGRNFTPTMKDVFTAFTKCPFDKVKVVLMGQDPYPYLGMADGIAFSCSKTRKLQPGLRYIFKAIEKTVSQEFPEEQDVDLSRWTEQGVLCLNTALTCQIDKIIEGGHYEIWKDFLFMVIDVLNLHYPHMPFLLIGKSAHNFSPYISGTCIKVSHPISATYTKNNEWNCEDCFNHVNTILKSQKQQPITW